MADSPLTFVYPFGFKNMVCAGLGNVGDLSIYAQDTLGFTPSVLVRLYVEEPMRRGGGFAYGG